jgi:predicted choloylglycine hydrolase
VNALAQFETAGSHFDVGFSIGRQFASRIHRTLDSYAFFQERLLPFHRSREGQARYQQFLCINTARFPDYVTELEGLAEGSERSFEDLFLVNMRGEYRDYLRSPTAGCFDCALVTDDVAVMGHNEDGSPAFEDNLYLIHARITGKPAFTALSYPGFLCGNAFGFNAEGICFSIDNVQPQDTRVGIGRHFVARSLLEARSLDDAVARVTVPDRASGFGYTIGSIPERRVVYLEVAPVAYHIREISGCYIHANHYLDLASIKQVIGSSSKARLERASALLEEQAPLDAIGVLSILGDEAHAQYPIYRSATPPDDGATLNTVLFDLDARLLRIYTGHPTRSPTTFVEFAM